MVAASYSVDQCPVRSPSYVDFLAAVYAATLDQSGKYRSRYFALHGQLTKLHDIVVDTRIDRVPWQDTSEHPALYDTLEVTFHGTLIDYMEEVLEEKVKCVVRLVGALPYSALQRYEVEAIERLAAWVLLYVDMPALYDVAPDLRPRLSSASAA